MNRYHKVYSTWSKESGARAKRHEYVAAPTGKQAVLYEKLFRQHLKGKKNAKVLILGHTPELRNMALKLGCETLAVDINYEVIFKLQSLIKKSEQPRNMIWRANWLAMEKYLQSHIFDIIAGDGAAGQLNIPDQKKLYRSCALLLKKDGALITRTDVYDPSLPKQKARDLVRQYVQGKITPIMLNCGVLLYSDVSKYCYNPQTYLMKTYKFWGYMEQFYKEGLVPKKQIEFFRKARQNLTHVMPPVTLLKKMTEPYFKQVLVKQHDPYWPTYMWIAK